jgi:uncharacterized protein GlcG (DUF336 family)
MLIKINLYRQDHNSHTKKETKMKLFQASLIAVVIFFSTLSFAVPNNCKNLPDQGALQKALLSARKISNGGFNLDMWATLVDRSGVVCAVAFTGEKVDSQWPGSRVISAQKANTANAFSLSGLALSTANLYAAVQPGGSLYGLQASNPVNPAVAYQGGAQDFGSKRDPMVGSRIGGVNVFGGGLALYDRKGNLLGGVGVSGDSSCADHNIAWRTRHNLALDFVPAGVAPSKDDQIIFDMDAATNKSAGGFGHANCAGTEKSIVSTLPKVGIVDKK